MELDDLRRHWQQTALPTRPEALDAPALARLLAHGSASPIAKMRRNAWLEIGMVVGCLLLCLGALGTSRDGYYLIMVGWMAFMCLLSGFYFHRKLAVLRSLSDANGAVRTHVRQQLDSLRSLVRLYFRATMWSVPASFFFGLFFIGGRMVQKLAGEKLLLGLGVLLLAYGLFGVVTYLLTRRFTTWYLQRLYGQHLDRLEGLLRELEEPAA